MTDREPRRLPGVRFDTPSPRAGSLPRMDVTAFVGFAASGPLDVPVLIDSLTGFTEVFGDDLALAWDARRGEAVTSLLGPAVRDYFRNGGRRCWVVRVAGGGDAPFDATSFFDEGLVDLLPHELATEADRRRALHASDSETALFKGVHAVWAIEEATIIAVPDATHDGWDDLQAPDDIALGVDAPVEAAEAPKRCCCREEREPPPRCPTAEIPAGAFRPSDKGPPVPAGFAVRFVGSSDVATVDGAGAFVLRWERVEDASYEVRESPLIARDGSTTRLVDPSLIYSGDGDGSDATATTRELTVHGRTPGRWHYQIRAMVDGVAGRWSDVLEVRVRAPARPVVRARAGVDGALVRLHRALIRMCAARGDLVAVLSLPERFREEDAIEHARRLRAYDDPDDRASVAPEVLSFGMIVHPWLLVLDRTRSVTATRVSPDGATCGVMASRALRRGAWICPANEPLADVVALTPPLLPSRLSELLDERINVVRQEARGFVALGADTLSSDPELEAVNVRRLMCFLRRVALQKGAEHAFEPHDDFLRREVKGTFERLLAELFQKGAFAGRKAESAYQVRADTTLNPPSAVDQGRLVVELKVAPSLPLSFITVRLTQQGEFASVTEVR